MKLSEVVTEFRARAAALAERLPVPPDYSAAHVHGFVKKALDAKSDEIFILEVSSYLWGLDLGMLNRLAEASPDTATFFRFCYEETLKRAKPADDEKPVK